jgi:hypothetical protein
LALYSTYKTCDLCLLEPGLLHLKWCSPNASIYFWITWFYFSLELNKTLLNDIFLIHLSLVWHLGCFYSLAIVDSATVNIGVHVSLLYPDLHSFGYMPKSCIFGSYDSSIFSFLRNFHSAFYSGCINLHPHQQCIRVPVLLHPHQHLLLFVFLIIAILTRMRWNLSVVFICISFIAREVEHFFMYLLSNCTSSFENYLFNSCVHFFIELLILWGWVFEFPVDSGYWSLIRWIANEDFLPESSDCVEAF